MSKNKKNKGLRSGISRLYRYHPEQDVDSSGVETCPTPRSDFKPVIEHVHGQKLENYKGNLTV